jgi:hypothetical protein
MRCQEEQDRQDEPMSINADYLLPDCRQRVKGPERSNDGQPRVLCAGFGEALYFWKGIW